MLPHGVHNILLNQNISLDDGQYYLLETYSLSGEEEEDSHVNDNITVDNLKKIDFKKIFYKQPTQLEKSSETSNEKSNYILKYFVEACTLTSSDNTQDSALLKHKKNRDSSPKINELKEKLLAE